MGTESGTIPSQSKAPLPTSPARQAFIYLVSFFLAPIGLWFAWKYLNQGDRIGRRIGFASIALTVISLALSVWTTMELYRSLGPLVKSLLQAYGATG